MAAGRHDLRENNGGSLLDLPPEIWSRICKLAVVYEEPIIVLAAGRHPAPPAKYSAFHDAFRRVSLHEGSRVIQQHRAMLVQPPITRVCRTIRAECLASYYADNIFCACDGAAVYGSDGETYGAVGRWFIHIGAVNVARIQHLYIVSQSCGDRYRILDLWSPGDPRHDIWIEASEEEMAMLKSGGCCGEPIWRVTFE